MLKHFGVDMVQGYHLDKPQEHHPALACLKADKISPDIS